MSGLARIAMLKSSAYLALISDDFEDPLEQLILAASDLVRKFTSRLLSRAAYEDERYDGSQNNKLYLREWPVVEVNQVEFWDGSEWFTEDAANYTLIRSKYIQYPSLEQTDAKFSIWPCTYPEGIKITYTAGYDNSNWNSVEAISLSFGVPADLEHAVLSVARKIWEDGKEGGNRFGLTQQSIGTEALTSQVFVRGLPPDILEIMGRYKRIEF